MTERVTRVEGLHPLQHLSQPGLVDRQREVAAPVVEGGGVVPPCPKHVPLPRYSGDVLTVVLGGVLRQGSRLDLYVPVEGLEPGMDLRLPRLHQEHVVLEPYEILGNVRANDSFEGAAYIGERVCVLDRSDVKPVPYPIGKTAHEDHPVDLDAPKVHQAP